jgi:hypothetical protein
MSKEFNKYGLLGFINLGFSANNRGKVLPLCFTLFYLFILVARSVNKVSERFNYDLYFQ